LSNHQAALLVAELLSDLRLRDQQLTALEHDLNNEIGTLQLVAHLMRGNSDGPDRNALVEALAATTARLKRLMDALAK
jgi:hypothetical protein